MQTIVLVLCYIVLLLLFSSAYNTSLIYCFVIWCLHTNKRRPCSSTLSGHPSSSVAFCFNYYFCWWGGLGWGGMLTFMLRSWCYVDHGVGWGGNVHATLMMLRWSRGGVGWDVNVHVMLMILRWSWAGVGWGGMLTFMLRSWCYAQKKVAGFETIGPPEDIPTCAVLSFISTPTF